MYQKYGSDRIRNLLVDRIESTAIAHNDAVYSLKAYDNDKTDYKEETNDPIQEAKGF